MDKSEEIAKINKLESEIKKIEQDTANLKKNIYNIVDDVYWEILSIIANAKDNKDVTEDLWQLQSKVFNVELLLK